MMGRIFTCNSPDPTGFFCCYMLSSFFTKRSLKDSSGYSHIVLKLPSLIVPVTCRHRITFPIVYEGGFEPPVHTTLVQTLVSKTSSLNLTRSLVDITKSEWRDSNPRTHASKACPYIHLRNTQILSG